MLSFIVELLNFLIDTIALCGQVIIFCGYSIAYIFSSGAIWACLILRNIFTVIHVLFEDLGCFLMETIDITEEVGSKVYNVVHVIKDILEDTYGSKLTNTLEWTGQTVKSVIQKQITFLINIGNLIRISVRLIIDALTLIGTVAQESFRLLLVLLYNIITAPITSLINLCTAVLDTFLILFNTVVNLPIESAIGLFVVTITWKLYNRYHGKKHMKALSKFIVMLTVRFLLLLVTMCILLKWYLLNFLKKLKNNFGQVRRMFHKTKIQAESPSKVELIKKLEQEISLRTCVVCMANPRDVMVVGCNHFCMCSFCAKQVRQINNECPVCRKRIYGLSGKVFM